MQASPSLNAPPVDRAGTRAALVILFAGIAALLAFAVSLTLVAGHRIDLEIALPAIWAPTTVTDSLIVHDLLLPRALVAAMVGANLAVAGALIQGVTRNPITEPSIIGVNAGAALAVVFVTIVLPVLVGGPTAGVDVLPWFDLALLPLIAFVGAAAAALTVYALASTGVVTPVRLALAGVTVAIFGQSLVLGAGLLSSAAVRFLVRWMVGGVDGMTWRHVATIAPYAIVGLVAAVLLARAVTVLSLGDDVARGLGQRVERVRLAAIALVAILAGASVSVAGPIAMVGLMVPHVARGLVGTSYRLVIPASALLGAALMLTADVAGRVVAPPGETPVGVLTAAIGTPFFIGLARRTRGSS